jgi:hypothetical protein
MRAVEASRIMPRTTIDIDAAVLRELKRRQRRDGKTMGRLVSELLTSALGKSVREERAPFHWTAGPLGIHVDLEDKEAVRRALGDHA